RRNRRASRGARGGSVDGKELSRYGLRGVRGAPHRQARLVAWSPVEAVECNRVGIARGEARRERKQRRDALALGVRVASSRRVPLPQSRRAFGRALKPRGARGAPRSGVSVEGCPRSVHAGGGGLPR